MIKNLKAMVVVLLVVGFAQDRRIRRLERELEARDGYRDVSSYRPGPRAVA